MRPVRGYWRRFLGRCRAGIDSSYFPMVGRSSNRMPTSGEGGAELTTPSESRRRAANVTQFDPAGWERSPYPSVAFVTAGISTITLDLLFLVVDGVVDEAVRQFIESSVILPGPFPGVNHPRSKDRHENEQRAPSVTNQDARCRSGAKLLLGQREAQDPGQRGCVSFEPHVQSADLEGLHQPRREPGLVGARSGRHRACRRAPRPDGETT